MIGERYCADRVLSTEKSAALLLVSSAPSSAVAQPRAIVRVSDMSEGGAGRRISDGGSAKVLVKAPYAVQSTNVLSQQTAPPEA